MTIDNLYGRIQRSPAIAQLVKDMGVSVSAQVLHEATKKVRGTKDLKKPVLMNVVHSQQALQLTSAGQCYLHEQQLLHMIYLCIISAETQKQLFQKLSKL